MVVLLISLFIVNKQVITVNKQMGVLGGGPNKQLAGPLDKELPHTCPRVAEIRADQFETMCFTSCMPVCSWPSSIECSPITMRTLYKEVNRMQTF